MNSVALKAIADIKIQAIMFNMDIDWETFGLVPKTKNTEDPVWLLKWKTIRQESDFDELIDIDWEDNGR